MQHTQTQTGCLAKELTHTQIHTGKGWTKWRPKFQAKLGTTAVAAAAAEAVLLPFTGGQSLWRERENACEQLKSVARSPGELGTGSDGKNGWGKETKRKKNRKRRSEEGEEEEDAHRASTCRIHRSGWTIWPSRISPMGKLANEKFSRKPGSLEIW